MSKTTPGNIRHPIPDTATTPEHPPAFHRAIADRRSIQTLKENWARTPLFLQRTP
jgi:hypothetical protein